VDQKAAGVAPEVPAAPAPTGPDLLNDLMASIAARKAKGAA
jgi:hypothetical protein